ncbi:DUF2617 family protein [Paludisphaera mucosa]|uniref:DUF2617 family protein n=1 Tax=Paludisphaera mucosa TaxID=3030827 RepID=A0ABT6F5H6_9BACT|nr:DUF2617 family protein [Paludisphaera mucosa]
MADRAFQVFQRALHPEWFSIRAHERFALGPWEADVRIVEGGHAVVFGSQQVGLTEVLGGPETCLPPEGLLLNSPVRRERTTVLRPGGLMLYQACLEVERVDLAVFRHLCDEMTIASRHGCLVHSFPAVNRMAPRPVSHIRVDRLARGLSIQTFHSFPDDLAILRSQSLFELTDPG